jgi:hypothetical protein
MSERKKKPLAWGKEGAVFHTSVGRFSDGSFWWFATEDYETFKRVLGGDPDAIAAQKWHGPFWTNTEAAKDAEIAIAGENCRLERAGMWDPAWNRPQ